MANYKTCEHCGAHLDYGERCDCQEGTQRPAAEADRVVLDAITREVIQVDMIRTDVLIQAEKRAGEDSFRQRIEASSASAALNGIAALIEGFSKRAKVPVSRTLALLAAIMMAPGIRADRAAEGD